ncbi:MAG: transporter substrate-binding domain-containing protein [Rhodospirillales bacterium]|nr:transporter substrate-binding domain-containing protein [Rhodospirillales bacterium]
MTRERNLSVKTRRQALRLIAGGGALAPVFTAGPARAAASEGALARIRRTRLMRVAMALNPPMVLQHTNGTWYGFNPDLVRMLGKEWGVKIDFVGATWATIVPGLLAHKYDMIGASISATALRKEVIDFTVPYFKAGQIFIVSKDNPKKLDSLASLDSPNVTVAFTQNTIEGEITRKLLPKAKERGLLSSSVGNLVAEVVSGRSDAFAITSTLRRPILAKFSWARAIPDTDEGVNATPVAWGVRKSDPELLAALNSFLAKENKSGAVAALYAKEVTPANSGLGT